MRTGRRVNNNEREESQTIEMLSRQLEELVRLYEGREISRCWLVGRSSRRRTFARFGPAAMFSNIYGAAMGSGRGSKSKLLSQTPCSHARIARLLPHPRLPPQIPADPAPRFDMATGCRHRMRLEYNRMSDEHLPFLDSTIAAEVKAM